MDEEIIDRQSKRMRLIALVVACLWAGWWTFFGIASSIGEDPSVAGVFIHTAVPGIVFLMSVFVAWRWNPIGGVVLIVEGLITLVGYPLLVGSRFSLSMVVFVLVSMSAPPVLAGSLLLAAWRRSQQKLNRESQSN